MSAKRSAIVWAAMAVLVAAGAAEAGTAAKEGGKTAKAATAVAKEAGVAEEGAAAPIGLQGVVNINTATPEELEMLPGIGPSKAKAIVLYRDGKPFKDPRHLIRVKGIGRVTLERLLPFLAVTGPTTIKVK